MGFLLKEALRTLCGRNQWSYAVFWKIGCHNSKLLIWEECYYEPLPCPPPMFGIGDLPYHNGGGHWFSSGSQSSQLGIQEEDRVNSLIKKMTVNNSVIIAGEGMIGRAAFTGNHQWILLNSFTKDVNPPELYPEVHHQFSAGIQTVAVIPVLPHGVVQLGSFLPINENMGFVNDVKSLILQLGWVPGALLSEDYSENSSIERLAGPSITGVPLSIDPPAVASNGTPSVTDVSNQKSNPSHTSRRFVHTPCPLNAETNTYQGSARTPESCKLNRISSNHCQPKVIPMSKANFSGQQESRAMEAEVITSDVDSCLQQHSVSYNARSAFNNLTTSGSFGQSCLSDDHLTLMEQQIISAIGNRDNVNPLFNVSGTLNMPHPNTDRGHILGHSMSSSSAPLQGGIPIHGGMSTLLRSNLITSPGSKSPKASTGDLSGVEVGIGLQNSDSSTKARGCSLMNSTSQSGTFPMHVEGSNQNMLPVDFKCVSTNQKIDYDLLQAPNLPTFHVEKRLPISGQIPGFAHDCLSKEGSIQSMMAMNPKLKLDSTKPPSGDDDLFDVLGVDMKNKLLNGNWNKLFTDELDANTENMDKKLDPMNMLDTTTNPDIYSVKEAIDSGIFSGTGTDHLLDAVVSKAKSVVKQDSDDMSCRTTLTRNSTSSVPSPACRPVMSGHFQGGIFDFPKNGGKTGATEASIRSRCNKEDAGNCSQTSSAYGSQLSSWVENSGSVKRENSVSTGYSKQPDEACKPNRKRLKPGENPRPRPKDRQMIQDRVKELREIVPNGAKCSIDALLERTIKHMLFLQSVTKHADKLKQTGESKIINKEGGLLLKDNFEGGATWAYEVGSQSMVCPIVVEDLNPPRHRSKPISISRSSTMERSYKSSRGSASPNRLSSSPRSGNNTLQSRGRSSLTPNSSPTQVIRQATPTRRPSPPPTKPTTPASRSSTPTPRQISTGSGSPAVSSGIRGTSPVKTSRGNSASPKIRAWQTNIPGFSSEAPPNLRTSLADRPASYVRGSSPASRNSRDSTSKLGRQSMSPTPSRSSSYINSHDRDQFSSRSKGSVISSGDDDLDSLQSIPVGGLEQFGSRRGASISNGKSPSISKKPVRMVSPSSAPKRSFDSALRQMDKKSPQNMFRPLLSSVPSTTFYVGKANSAQRSLVSRNSSVTTSSNASSDHGTSFAPDTEGSDHNQDDVTSETEKIIYADIHEEVFSFDKIDVLNANIGHEINDESVDVLHNKTRGHMIALGPTESEASVYHGIGKEFSESLETSHVIVDISKTGAFENTAICSNCGCPLEATDETEKNLRLCQECSRKTTLLRHIFPEATLAVSSGNSVNSTSIPTEEKTSHETDQLTVESRLPQETNVGNMRFPLREPDAEENQTFPSELIWDHSQQNPLSSSVVERNEQVSTNQLEVDKSRVDYEKPDNHSGDQQLHLSEDRSILKVDLLEGTGISVLLKRSSSSKGPVIQGRTFTATTLSYDDLSFARNSINSIRSSTGRSSYSTSSSVDFSSTRHSDFRVQRQSSARKLDVDYGYDVRIRPPSPGSSFSGMSSHSYHGLGFTAQETSSGNTECSNLEEIPQDLLEMQASENKVTDVIDSSMSSIVVKEDNLEYHDRIRRTDACISELVSQATGVRPDDNSVASFPNHESCISNDKTEDHPNNVDSVSNTKTSVQDPESSFGEKHNIENSKANGLHALVTTNTSTIEESEIEGENCCQNDTGVVDDDSLLVSKCPVDDFQEHSVSISSSDCLAASVSELNASEYSLGIEGSTVTVECQDGVNTRSLTLEEATDTILFCSSIIHDLAYKAATISMEKEDSEPLEGSEPRVTILGKPNSNVKDTRSQIAPKRAMKPHKARPKMVETDVKSQSPSKTENDENADESLIRNVGLPNKVDSMKPPNKLESKCNCIIM